MHQFAEHEAALLAEMEHEGELCFPELGPDSGVITILRQLKEGGPIFPVEFLLPQSFLPYEDQKNGKLYRTCSSTSIRSQRP